MFGSTNLPLPADLHDLRKTREHVRIRPICGLCLAALMSSAADAQPVVLPVEFEHVVVDSNGPLDPWGKSLGDMNGDGRIDLIVGGSRDRGLVWYENPNWKKHFIRQSGQWSTDHETVDLDRDGDLDVVSLTKDRLVWYAAPDFAEHQIDRRVLHDLEIADFDNDGFVDIVARDQGEFGHSGELLHFYWQGPGLDEWEHRELACPDGEGLVVGDLDGDQDPDIVLNAVWFENADAAARQFVRHSYSSTYTHAATFVALHDINGDQRVDILLAPSELAGQRYRIAWLESPENVHDEWPEHVIDNDVEAVHHFIAGGDFNRDGFADVVTAEMHQGQDPDEVKLYWQTVSPPGWQKQVIAESGSHSMRVLDVDLDGDLDLFGANHQGHVVDLWINRLPSTRTPDSKLGPWTHLAIDRQRDSRAFGICWGDVDHDGDVDIASGHFLYKNPGGDLAGSWQRVRLPRGVDANAILDVDGDDMADIIAQDLPRVVWLEATTPEAEAFAARTLVDDLPATSHGNSQGFTTGDVLGSPKSDFVLTTGGGVFAIDLERCVSESNYIPVLITDQAPEEGLALGDIDRDGAVDIVAWLGSGSGSQQLAWWKNPGDANDANWNMQPIGRVEGSEGDRVVIADFDADGWLDVAATGTTNAASGSSILWFKNPHEGNEGWKVFEIGKDLGAMNSMDVGDIDGDGRPDLVTGEHRGNKRTTWWISRQPDSGSDVEWLPIEVDRGRESHLGTQAVDLDGDGDLDLISIAWDDYQTLHVWRNDTRH